MAAADSIPASVSTRLAGDVTIIDVSGRVTLGTPANTLHDAVSRVIESESKKLVLNLGKVDYLDSSGIGELLSAFKRMASAGGALKLAGVGKRVEGLLRLTGLIAFFDVQVDEMRAVKSFSDSI